MRLFARALLCVGALLAVAGCSQYADGVGTRLYPDDVANQTQLQNAYVEDVCKQAGLEPTGFDGTTSCGTKPFDPGTWWLFVQAGMNDIDRRCDDYLTWLDDLKRSRVPILNQISQTRTVTEGILRAAAVHVTPITIVGLAFGLASDTFTNINDRLILELPHSTVQAVVLSRQKQYREDLIGTSANKPRVVITSRPAAIYALRQYLRLCMPMTIETEVNNTVTVDARGGPEALMRSEPMISAKSVGVATITNPNAPTPSGPKAPKPLPGDTRYGKFEKPIPPDTIRAYQRALCIRPEDGILGAKGSITRTGIGEYLLASGSPDTSGEFKADTLVDLQLAVRRIKDCRANHYMNAFEVGRFGVAADPSKAIKGLQRDLALALSKKGFDMEVPETGSFGPDNNGQDATRTAIAQFRLRALDPTTAPNDKDLKDPQFRQLNSAVRRSINLVARSK